MWGGLPFSAAASLPFTGKRYWNFVLFLHVLLFFGGARANNAKPPNASKLRTDMSKMRIMEAKNRFKQQQTVKAQSYSPRFGDREKEQSSSNALRHVEYQAEGDKPVFQLFVRRRQTGPWFRYDDLQENDAGIQATCEQIVLHGGLEAEYLRAQVDAHMVAKIFGSDVTACSNLSINKIKGNLPQFKKVRPRDLEVGYRLAAEGEDICSLTSLVDLRVSAASMSATDGPAAIAAAAAPVIALDVKALMLSLIPLPAPTPALLLLRERIAAFTARIPVASSPLAQPLVDLYLCSDGSALACGGGSGIGGGGGGWQDASAGVFAMCVPREGWSRSGGENDAEQQQQEEEKKKEKEKEEEEKGAEKKEEEEKEGALRLRISDVAPVVESPFDAELVAGMAAAALARGILRAAPAGSIGSVVLLTDSKTLVRACRTGPAGNPELARRGPQRQVLWEMLMAALDGLAAAGTPLLLQWTSGHPERRGGDPDTWTFEDVAIWEADNIAKPAGHGAERCCLELKDLLVYMNSLQLPKNNL